MKIFDLQKEAHAIAKEKGWHDESRSVGDLIALCHSELSEALEIARHPSWGTSRIIPTRKIEDSFGGHYIAPEGFGIELADVVIRILDMAELYGLDLEAAIKMKMDYNRTRPYRHGGKIL